MLSKVWVKSLTGYICQDTCGRRWGNKPSALEPTGVSCSSAGKESVRNDGRHWFDPWVGKIPWIRERLPTPVFWPGEFHGLCSSWGRKESDMTE